MTRLVRKYTLPLALLLSLFFLSGTVTSTVVLANQSLPDQCCDKESAPLTPESDGECFNCSCLTCLVAIHPSNAVKGSFVVDTDNPLWLLSNKYPSDYIQTIDYPPEFA